MKKNKYYNIFINHQFQTSTTIIVLSQGLKLCNEKIKILNGYSPDYCFHHKQFHDEISTLTVHFLNELDTWQSLNYGWTSRPKTYSKLVCVQLSRSAVNVALPAFTAMPAMQQLINISYSLGLQQQPHAWCCSGRMGQTDRQTL